MAFGGDIPWEFVIFVALFAIALFYFIFIQSYLSGLILRGFMACFMRNLKIRFKRSSFSPLSGHFSLHNVRVITVDMRIVIRRVTASWKYWRKIPMFVKNEKTQTRLRVNMEAVEVTIYNRAWTVELLQEVVKMYNDGKSTQEVTEYLKSFNAEPGPNVISVLWNVILPMSFKIKALVVTIGNPKLPSSLILTTKKVYGKFTILPRADVHHHMRQQLTVEMTQVNFRSEPKDFVRVDETEGCMRNVFQRSRQSYEILNTNSIKMEMLKDMFGCYSQHENENAPTMVTAPPEFKLSVVFDEEEQPVVTYGPYVDKLRAAFQKFFTPFMFNNPQFFPDNHKRVKYMDIDVRFPKGILIDMPFVTADMRSEHLYMDFSQEGAMHVVFPQFISEPKENKMHIQAEMNGFKVLTSVAKTSVLSCETFLCSYVQAYPERWNDVMSIVISCTFCNSTVFLAPYHIDFLTQFSQEWASPYPFPQPKEDQSTFKPFEYFITLQMMPFRLFGLTKTVTPFEAIDDIGKHPHIDLRSEGAIFKLSVPNCGWCPKTKTVSYSGEFTNSGLGFMWPANDIHAMRRAPEVVSDHLILDSMSFSGSYSWTPGIQGNVQNVLSMRMSDVGGMVTIYTFQDLLEVIKNYTTAPKHKPIFEQDDREEQEIRPLLTNNHSCVTVQIDSLSVKVPWDLYETKNCMVLNAGVLLVGIEGYYPFWHADVNIDAMHVDIPTADFPGDRFYVENLGDPSDGKAGTVHAAGFHVKVRSIQSTEPGVNVSNAINLEVGTIGGFVTVPTLYNILEFVVNFMFYWNGDELKEKRSWDPRLTYGLSCIRVGIGTANAFLDFGRLGLLSASLPAGVVIYSDNLIEKTSNNIYHIAFPVIDAVFLNATSEGTLNALLRATTYFNIIVQMQYPNAKFHQVQQAIVLRRANHTLKMFDFVDSDPMTVDESFTEKPEIYFPEKFRLSLTETFKLYQSYRTDPRNRLEYSLPIPSIDYETMHEFITYDVSALWLHKMHVSRCYTHLFPHEGRRVSTLNGPLPSELRDNGIVYPERTMTMSLIVPNDLYVQIRPKALEPIIAALKILSLKPDCQMLARYTREAVSKETNVQDTAVKYIMVALPKVSVMLDDELFQVVADINSFGLFLKNEVRNKKSNLTVELLGIAVKGMLRGNEHAVSLQVAVPTVQVASAGGQTVVKVASELQVDFNNDSVSLVSELVATLIEGAGTIGSVKTKNRTTQLYRVLQADESFADEKYGCERALYDACTNPRVTRRTKAEVTAMYLTKNRLNISNFADTYSFYKIPPKTKSMINSQLLVLPITLRIRGHHTKEKSEIEIKFLPVRMLKQGEHMALECGIRLVSVDISPEILPFISGVRKPRRPEPGTKIVKKKPPKGRRNSFKEFHIVIHDVSARFGANISAGVSSISACVSKGYKQLMVLGAIGKVTGIVNDHAELEWDGIQVCLRQETSVGIIRVGPLSVSVSLDLLLSPFEVLGFQLPKSKKAKMPKKPKKASRQFDKFLEEMSVTIIISQVSVSVRVSDTITVTAVLPGFAGLGYSHDQVSYQFGHLKGLNLSIPGFMHTYLPDTLSQGSYNQKQKEVWVFVMCGDLQWKTDRKKILQITPALNEILMRVAAKKPKALAPVQKKPKKSSAAMSPSRKRSSGQIQAPKLKFTGQFLMSQMSFEIEDIESKIEIKAPFGMIEIGKEKVWRFNMEQITLHIFDLCLLLVAQGSDEVGTTTFSITHFGVKLPKDFIPKLQRFKTFFEYIREQTKSQKKVDTLIQNINTQIHYSVEKGAAEVIETMTKPVTDDVEFPAATASQVFVQILNVQLSIDLEGGGTFLTEIPESNLLVKSRGSELHDEKARAIKLEIYDLKVQLDSQECGVTTSSDAYTGTPGWFQEDANLSMLKCKLISLSVVTFNNTFNGSAVVDSLRVEVFPSLPFALAHLFLLTKPKMSHPRRKSVFYTSMAAVRKQLEEEEEIHEEEKGETNLSTSGRAVFKLLNSELVFSPISNVIPLHSVVVDCEVCNNALQATLVVEQTIVIELTPKIIEWSMIFQKSVVDAMKSVKQSPIPASPKSPAKSNKMKVRKVKMSVKIAALVHLIELRFSCAPRKSDLAFAVGVTSIHVLGSISPRLMSARVGQIYLRTENEGVPTRNIARTDRLLEFIVPTIDALIGPRKIVSRIDNVMLSVSIDRVDEVSLFMDIWVSPLLQRLKQVREHMSRAPKTKGVKNPSQSATGGVIEVQLREFNINLSYAAGIGNIHLAIVSVNIIFSGDYDGATVGKVQLSSQGHIDGTFAINNISLIRTKVEDSFSGIMHIENIESELKVIEETIFVFSVQGLIIAAQKFEKRDSVMFNDIFMCLGSPVVKGCSQAVTAMSQIVQNIVDPIKEKIQISRQIGESMPMKKPQPEPKPEIRKELPFAQLTLLTENVEVDLFKYYFSDKDAVFLNIESALLRLTIKQHGDMKHRELRMALNPSMISRLTTQGRATENRVVLHIPKMTGDLKTNEADAKVRYDFTTQFDGALEPSLTLSDYEVIISIIKYVVTQIINSLKKEKKDPEPEEKQTPGPKPKKEPRFAFEPGRYEFNPGIKVGIGAAVNPDIKWVLSHLNISDEHLIPSSLFEYVCLTLEKFMVIVSSKMALRAIKAPNSEDDPEEDI